MLITIKGTNLEISGSLQKWVGRKMRSLVKLHPDFHKKDELPSGEKDPRTLLEVEIEKMVSNQRKGKIFRAEGQFHLPGELIRAEVKTENPRSAVVELKKDLQRRVRKYKGKRKDLFREGARKEKKKR